MNPVDLNGLLDAIRSAVHSAGNQRISRLQFLQSSGLKQSDIGRHFARWSDALTAAGFAFQQPNERIDPEDILADWGLLVRKFRRIPTRQEYKLEGNYSATIFERKFGPWSSVPRNFREFAADQSEWSDVVALLPVAESASKALSEPNDGESVPPLPVRRQPRMQDRPTYGDPIDFRGLRHVPVNEDGVIFLFGMVARELGYLVESVQGGFPDCEAKRQIGPGQWQRVRIEFEFESRNFRDHGHQPTGCDIIVCWSHNWSDCPNNLEVVELQSVIRELSAADD